MSDYHKIEQAIGFIQANRQQQPSLQAIANHVNLSAYHFQRLFSRWAGISPKRFLQVLTLADAKQHLATCSDSTLTVSESLGLSSSSRLYDHFVQLNAVTPSEYKTQGMGLTIYIGFFTTPYGEVFIASTDKGICQLLFCEQHTHTQFTDNLQKDWPKATIIKNQSYNKPFIEQIFFQAEKQAPLSLWVKGTNFQINVWQALLNLQAGQLASYSDIATAIHKPGASRAVGSAIGSNPIAFCIPCHRVIQQSGNLGGYRWGIARKQAILAREMAQLS